MNELKISQLMDDYQDDEFFPEGGSTADVEAVKARVLAQVGAAAPAKKKMPRRKKLFLAGALAAVLVILVGAGWPTIAYQLANGTLTFEQTATSKSSTLTNSGPIVGLEDGRVVSLLDGEHVDITDRISEDTPYIRDLSGSDGMPHYVIMGGTPEKFGSFEWIVTPDPYAYQEGEPTHEGTEQGILCSYIYESYRQGTDENGEPHACGDSSHMGSGTICLDQRFGWKDVPAWLLSAMGQLEIPYELTFSEEITIIHS